ncbi:MAG: PAS domain S-box protein [Haloarculaceae archaeon]
MTERTGSARILYVGDADDEAAATLRALAADTDALDVLVTTDPEEVRRHSANGVACVIGVDGALAGDGSLSDLVGDVDVPVTVLEDERPDLARSVAETFVERTRRDRIYESLVDAAPTPILIHDEDATIRYANDRAADLVGVPDGDALVGERSLSFIASEQREVAAERMRRVFEEHQPTTEPVEYRVAPRGDDADADTRYSLTTGIPVTYRGSAASLVLLNDVTDHKRHRTRLQAERDRFVTLFQNLPNPVVHGVVDGDDLVVRNVNEAFEETFGLDVAAVEGEPLRDYIAPDHADAESVTDRVLDEGELTTVVERQTVDGVRDFQLDVVLRDGDPPEGYTIYTDITDRKDRERRLQRQNDRLEEFASIVSHDLRNPLNVASGYAELLAREYNDERVEKLDDAIERMDALIEKVLAMARQGRVVEEPEPIAMRPVIERCWGNVATGPSSLSVDAAFTLVADRERIAQLLENLFRNAVEHSDGPVTVRVGPIDDGTVSSAESGDPSSSAESGDLSSFVEGGFYVADDGPGIPEGDRERIFETGYSTSEGGTGLGLNIVEQVASAHGWEVRVTDSETGGARFEFTGVELA